MSQRGSGQSTRRPGCSQEWAETLGSSSVERPLCRRGSLRVVARPPAFRPIIRLDKELIPLRRLQPSQKTFRIKSKLAVAAKKSRPIPQWFRLKTDNKIQYNKNRRHWRRTKLGL
ncbi:hypothetical protein FA09DRAFT_330481 [Tilletiopsis washingtonensis]|uniref:Large ribosomal subunit protein eL39 n=1 Tax=Tilletiopsis washingtonensis TaxID=58919 RepID=A0A316Z7T3_9BASI|nr:hypothetical protein FA09DRAFT_330481 [Tilletiopsis washingtonensis]PWN97316.1 hypothetical protein FA09DRAFT_330481 [Tilletiopsis washingtonensis]